MKMVYLELCFNKRIQKHARHLMEQKENTKNEKRKGLKRGVKYESNVRIKKLRW